MTVKQKILSTIGKNRLQLKAFGVKRIGLFGSFAREEQKAKSDVDVLVEFDKKKKTFDNYMDLKFFLEKQFHRKVDILLKGSLKAPVKESVAKDITYASL
jgi:predicted nucleotidyltransferase